MHPADHMTSAVMGYTFKDLLTIEISNNTCIFRGNWRLGTLQERHFSKFGWRICVNWVWLWLLKKIGEKKREGGRKNEWKEKGESWQFVISLRLLLLAGFKSSDAGYFRGSYIWWILLSSFTKLNTRTTIIINFIYSTQSFLCKFCETSFKGDSPNIDYTMSLV